MVLLRLLAFTLVSSYIHPGTEVDAQRQDFITPVLEIHPQPKVFEGDQLNVTCGVRNIQPVWYLGNGTTILSRGQINLNTMVVRTKDTLEFKCSLEMGSETKNSTRIISVTELFSSPTLTVFPADVFQGENMSLSCKSESFASERINKEDLTYTLEPPDGLISTEPGVFSGRVPVHDFNYTCVAQAKGIKKRSEALTVRPKVPVSTPKISAIGQVILGQPVEIRCLSDSGSFPISYTLLRNGERLNTSTVSLSTQEAVFTVTIDKPEEISKHMCEAKNNHKDAKLSQRLDATLPGSLPKDNPGSLNHEDQRNKDAGLGTNNIVPGEKITAQVSTRKISAVGQAKNNHKDAKLSQRVNATLHEDNPGSPMALWEKVAIGGVCLLAASVLVYVLYVKSMMGRGSYSVAYTKY